MSENNETGRPIFELMSLGGDIKIYANGLVEGWPETWPKLQGICNYLPLLLSADQLELFSKRRQSSESKSPTSKLAPSGASHS